MIEMATFSIVIPHYNSQDLLSRCLDSIPDIKDIKVIVVDNNSSPDKVDFDNFPGKNRQYTKIIFDKEGRGAGHARNVGLKEIEGKWVLFADADDYFCNGWYNEVLSQKDSTADVIYYLPQSVESVTGLPSWRADIYLKNYKRYINGECEKKDFALSYLVPWCKMIRIELLKENGIDFEEVRYSNDVMFATKVACCARNIQISDFTLYTITTSPGEGLTGGEKTDPNNFYIRFCVMVRRNQYLIDKGQKPAVLFWSWKNAARINWQLGVKVFVKLVSSCQLFVRFGDVVKEQYYKHILHKTFNF